MSYIQNLRQVKIRIQGKPGKEMWGNLNSSLPVSLKRSKRNRSEFSVKDAQRHVNILNKIEKYKEDKILQELQLIQAEKERTARMMRIKRIKEQRRNAYLSNLK